MGNREDLLAGAKRCLYEKGYASTTARDIATASGTSLAAIGYHFGSKDALMNQARLQAFGDWTDQLTRALETELDPATPAIERFEAIWTKMIELFEANRPMWLASFEILAQIDHDPQVRNAVAEAQQRARLGLAMLFHDIDPSINGQQAHAVGSFYLALLPGVMAQWLIDPDEAPTGRDLAAALQTIQQKVQDSTA
ncbi:MAG TPA: TetR/AcrR family transcriptional regulator [Propionibacteriaceae bacterium]|nr:TetR/AcrR family transcriptional regulator [Propionibacteriaceae bacterium]